MSKETHLSRAIHLRKHPCAENALKLFCLFEEERKMKTRNLNIALLVTIILVSLTGYSTVFGSTVWNITDDFSVNNGNPNGSWSYGWMDTAFMNFTLYESGDYHGPGPQASPIWYTETENIHGCVWENTGEPVYGTATGQLAFHPGQQGGWNPAVAHWTAPEGISGLCTIEGQFFSGDYDNRIQVAVRINSMQVWHAVDYGAFNLSTNVAPGDTIDFAVYGGDNSGGTTPLDATITVVPEPATLMLLGVGGLILRKRRQ
jgi:hypothetical protein